MDARWCRIWCCIGSKRSRYGCPRVASVTRQGPRKFPYDGLQAAGVDLSFCPRYDGKAGRCVMVDSGGRRFAWSTPPVDDIQFDAGKVLEDVSYLVLGPVWGDWAEKLVVEAQKRSIPCALFGEAPPAAQMYSWDLVIIDEGQHRGSLHLSASLKIVTRGAAGALVLAKSKELDLPAVDGITVVDSTGAGDSYSGAFIARYINGESVELANEAAAAAAASVCQHWGCWRL